MDKRFYKCIALQLGLFLTSVSFSQSVSINNDGAIPDSTAIVDISSTKKGLLIPRMTLQQKNSIANAAVGLLVFQTDGDSGFYYFTGSNWLLLINNIEADKQKSLIYTVKGF